MINAVGNTHALAGDIELAVGVCACSAIHVAIENHSFGCDLQIPDAETARAIARDLLTAADMMERPTRGEAQLHLVKN